MPSNKERAKEWREKNPERFKATQKECYLKRHKYYLKKAAEYRAKHKKERKKYDKKRKNEEPHRKLLLQSKIPIRCKLCGINENINFIQMSVHHVDGNKKNNDISNLVWICESCHQYLHNSKGIHSKLIKIGDVIEKNKKSD